MATAKFEDVRMAFMRNEFMAEGLGPDNGRGDFGLISFFYQDSGKWIKFSDGQCGNYDHHAPNEIAGVSTPSTLPKGDVNVVVCFTKHEVPPNDSSSSPMNVRFPK